MSKYLKITQMLAPTNKHSKKCPYSMTPTRLVVHNTYNSASALNEISYMISNNNSVSFHYAVDEKEAIQGILLNRNAWHAGDGNEKGNRQGIGIEICRSLSDTTTFLKAEDNGAYLCAKLLVQYGWGMDKLTKHQDYSGKYCPHKTLDLGWSRFRNIVQKYYNEIRNGATTSGTVDENPKRDPELLEGDVNVKAKETFVIACDRDKMNWIGELVKTGYDRSNGAYSNVVVLQNKKSSIAPYRDCPYKVAVCSTAKEISTYCNYAIIGTEEEIKKGIFEFANGANKQFEASNFR